MVDHVTTGVVEKKLSRILAVIPLIYGDARGFWNRDAGLFVLTLRSMGYDAWLVALYDPAQTPAPEMPVIRATVEELGNPAWWQNQRPDGVILNTWSAPRYDAMRKAALTATPRVVERLDTDGARSARLFPKPLFYQLWGTYADNPPGGFQWLAKPIAAARTAACYTFPALMDRRMVDTMKQLPGFIVESPIAAERIQRMFETFAGERRRIEVIPPPVNVEEIHRVDVPRENRIITVGRWASVQKDFPMLQKTLKGFLQRHPDWQATIVGSGIPGGQLTRIDPDGRITHHEKLTHQQLAVEYSRSKIYLMISRYESFCIAAAEALCCGCSVVGSSNVPSSYYFAETQSGCVADPRTPKGFAEALDREVESWKKGERNPETIAAVWLDRAGASAVARSTLAFLESMHG
jgi:glycosyltransferase involved in cell wall biosynthesis